jgi:hypothetical protein
MAPSCNFGMLPVYPCMHAKGDVLPTHACWAQEAVSGNLCGGTVQMCVWFSCLNHHKQSSCFLLQRLHFGHALCVKSLIQAFSGHGKIMRMLHFGHALCVNSSSQAFFGHGKRKSMYCKAYVVARRMCMVGQSICRGTKVYTRYFWQGNDQHTVVYGAYIQLWPTLRMCYKRIVTSACWGEGTGSECPA